MNDKSDKDSKVSDLFKKVVSIGAGAAFMTEDTIRQLVSDLPIPKDTISGLIQGAMGMKEDLTSSIRDELTKYISKMNISNIVDDVLQNYDLEIKSTIKFKPKKKSKSSAEKNIENNEVS